MKTIKSGLSMSDFKIIENSRVFFFLNESKSLLHVARCIRLMVKRVV